jgi:hypothetical protein
MQVPQGGVSSYGIVGNSEFAGDVTENTPPRERWSVPDGPKDTFCSVLKAVLVYIGLVLLK